MPRAILFLLLSAFLPAAFAQPTLLINNAALPLSSQPPRIAPRSLIQVMLNPSFAGPLSGNAQVETLDPSQPLSLTIEAEGSEPRGAEILTASSFNLIAVLPEGLPLGPATMTLTYNGGITSSGTVEFVASRFALFASGFGFGPAVAQNVNPGSEVELNGLTQPALPGSYITLWGTGLNDAALSDITVVLDGHEVPVQFAGPAPGLAGLDQINAFIPVENEIADGCYVPLLVSVRGEASNSVSVSKTTAPGPCVHPLGLSEQQMRTLDEGGTVPIGRIGIYRSIGPPNVIATPGEPVEPRTLMRFESAEASFFATDAGGVARWSRSASRDEAAGALGCRLDRPSISGIVGSFINGSGTVRVGDNVGVSGPDGQALELSGEFGLYRSSIEPSEPVEDPADLPPPFFAAGEWEFSAEGSSQVAPFRVAVRLPPAVEVTNFQQLTSINRTAGVTVTWNPDGYRESDTIVVQIAGMPISESEPQSRGPSLSLTCNVAVLEGQLEIEPELLQEFAATPPGAPAHLSLNLNGPPEGESHFTVELVGGPGSDPAEAESIPGLISYGSGEFFPIELQ